MVRGLSCCKDAISDGVSRRRLDSREVSKFGFREFFESVAIVLSPPVVKIRVITLTNRLQGVFHGFRSTGTCLPINVEIPITFPPSDSMLPFHWQPVAAKEFHRSDIDSQAAADHEPGAVSKETALRGKYRTRSRSPSALALPNRYEAQRNPGEPRRGVRHSRLPKRIPSSPTPRSQRANHLLSDSIHYCLDHGKRGPQRRLPQVSLRSGYRRARPGFSTRIPHFPRVSDR